MARFVDVWSKVEALELKSPLAQLGSFLRCVCNSLGSLYTIQIPTRARTCATCPRA